MSKKSILITLLVTLYFIPLNAQTANERITQLLNEQDWIEVEKEYPVLKENVDPYLQLFTEAMLGIIFNQPEQALEAIDNLFTQYQPHMGISNIISMIYFQSSIQMDKGEYKQVAETLTNALAQFKDHLPPESLTALTYLQPIAAKLQNEKPVSFKRPKNNIEIPIIIEEINIKGGRPGAHQILINTEINGSKQQMIFDTGAEHSYFSEEFARNNKIRIVHDSILISGGREHNDYAYLGIIDQLKIGKLSWENGLAYIGRPNPAVDSVLVTDAVFGRDLMMYIEEFIIYPKENKIVFPTQPTPLPETGKNMFIFIGQPYVQTFTNGEKLYMHFDTGNRSGELHHKYYEKHKRHIISNYHTITYKRGNIGEIREAELYRMPNFPLQIGNTLLTFNEILIEPNYQLFGNTISDGALGMDFILQCSKIIVNFKDMFIQAEL